MGYFRQMYGLRSKEFCDGAEAAMEAFAVWNHGTQWVGSPERRLKETILEVRKDLLGEDGLGAPNELLLEVVALKAELDQYKITDEEGAEVCGDLKAELAELRQHIEYLEADQENLRIDNRILRKALVKIQQHHTCTASVADIATDALAGGQPVRGYSVRDVLADFLRVWELAEGNRGCYSCHDQHDMRCFWTPKNNQECVCYRLEIEGAAQRARDILPGDKDGEGP